MDEKEGSQATGLRDERDSDKNQKSRGETTNSKRGKSQRRILSYESVSGGKLERIIRWAI